MRDIYLISNLESLTNFSTEAIEGPNLKIWYITWYIFQMFTKTITTNMRIFITCIMERSIPVLNLKKSNEKWNKNMIRISK